jgi:hypothetical protein
MGEFEKETPLTERSLFLHFLFWRTSFFYCVKAARPSSESAAATASRASIVFINFETPGYSESIIGPLGAQRMIV